MNGFFITNEKVKGRVKSTGKKYGFLTTEKGDVFIPPNEFQKVFNGDFIEGVIFFKDNKPQIEIKKVIEHKYKSYIGICKITENGTFVIPEQKDEANIHHWLRIPKAKRKKANDGDYVRVNIIEYPIENKKPKGEIVKVIGSFNSPNFEANYYFEKMQIPVYFSNEVTDKSYEFDQDFITSEKNNGRKDLTMLPFLTIDGENTRDIDDAIMCKKTNDGWKLWVAISDVSAFIKENDIIDKEAYKRVSSVYTPLRYISMLPENLSSNLCSLSANVERLVMVCYMQISNDGAIENYSFYEGVIRSKARMTYSEVEDFLNNKLEIEYDNSVMNNLDNICKLHKILRTYRKDNFLVTPREDNIRYIFDENRQVKDVQIKEYQRSNKVVEEVMLLANMAAADFLSKNYKNSIYRSNSSFDEYDNFISYLNDLNIIVDGDLNDLNIYVETFMKIFKNEKALTSLNYFLKQSEYSKEEKNHLGLGVNKYTYFTSPIRRYADILVHRMIKKIISNKECNEINDEIINHLNKTENNIKDVTSNIIRLINCKLINNKFNQDFNATIVMINSFGCKVYLENYSLYGFVKSESIGSNINFDDKTKKIKSDNKVLQLGDKIIVNLLSVDIENRNILFKLK